MTMDHSSMTHQMYFVASNQVTVLFSGFTVSSIASYFGAIAFTFFLVILAVYSHHALEMALSAQMFSVKPYTIRTGLLRSATYTIDLFIMLIAMTFNVGLFITIVVAAGISQSMLSYLSHVPMSKQYQKSLLEEQRSKYKEADEELLCKEIIVSDRSTSSVSESSSPSPDRTG
eukprot:CAMPEP_0184650686 /NCGR_PEP_ID=MMETSP0308-20130426/8267_1 /TAXON_ID=38269 /ORGANISM="Gloeochaete witrockiana, Strain SAG 46.84" /LENGTH=172 /DNA_ID=CAMNT_0027084421 /DNA_START=315 /DNA_END=833 /DNA_ORIENTATION=-